MTLGSTAIQPTPGCGACGRGVPALPLAGIGRGLTGKLGGIGERFTGGRRQCLQLGTVGTGSGGTGADIGDFIHGLGEHNGFTLGLLRDGLAILIGDIIDGTLQPLLTGGSPERFFQPPAREHHR